jgi:hypothetical protein
MFSQVSYNVVVERFKAFAAGHYLIKRFSHGQIDVTDIMKDAEYPWMHIVPVSMNPSTGTRSFSFDIIFADLPRDKEDKTEYQRESLSDCIRLAEDLLAEIQNGNIIFGQDVELEDGASISPFMEEYTHVLTGVTLSLTMTFPWDWNACEIPSDWSAGGSGSGGTGGGGASLLLKTNGTPNIIQNILDLVDGTGMDIIDLGDGRVQFTSTGGGGTSAIGSIEFNPNHIAAKGNPYTIGDIVYYLGSIYRCIATNDAILPTNATYWTLIATGYRIRQSPVDWNDTSGDYQILNKPTIPDVLDDLTDVNVAGAVQNNVLLFDGSVWVDQMLADIAYSGEFSDLKTIPNLDDLNDVKVPSPNDGEVLTYDTATGFWVSAPAPTASQGFQDVLIQDSVLTQANVINASGFNFEIQDIYDLNLTGSYRGTIKSTIPSSDTTQGLEYGADFVKIECQNNTTSDYGQIQVNSQGLGISTQSGTDLTAINMSPTQIGIRTPNVVDGIASVGQVLTLQNATTGDVEYTSVGIGDMTKAVYDTDDDGVVDFAKAVKTKVRNSTGAVLHKGHIVYLSGSTGNVPNAVYAQANNDANSAQTFGVVYADIANNSNGFVVMLGAIDTLDTRTTAPNPFTSDTLVDGQVIYLSPTTAGHITNVKPSAPNHLVYVGYVIRTSPTNGTIEYRIQNGYELDELHDVSVLSPTSQDYLYYDGGTSLWKSKQLVASAITDSTDAGRNVLTIPNPSAIRYLRINADNSVSALTASQLKSDLGFITQIQSTQLTNSSSSINVTISGCTIALEANTNYTGKMTIASGSVPVLGYTLVFNFPIGTTIRAGRLNSSSSTTAQVMLWQEMTSGVAFGTQFGNAQNQSGYAEIQLYISVGATAGNFTQDFRSGSNGSAITIYAGLTSIQLQKV